MNKKKNNKKKNKKKNNKKKLNQLMRIINFKKLMNKNHKIF